MNSAAAWTRLARPWQGHVINMQEVMYYVYHVYKTRSHIGVQYLCNNDVMCYTCRLHKRENAVLCLVLSKKQQKNKHARKGIVDK